MPLSVSYIYTKKKVFSSYEDSSLCFSFGENEGVTVSVLAFVCATNVLNGFFGGSHSKGCTRPLQELLGFSILFVLRFLGSYIRPNQKKKIIAIFYFFAFTKCREQ